LLQRCCCQLVESEPVQQRFAISAWTGSGLAWANDTARRMTELSGEFRWIAMQPRTDWTGSHLSIGFPTARVAPTESAYQPGSRSVYSPLNRWRKSSRPSFFFSLSFFTSFLISPFLFRQRFAVFHGWSPLQLRSILGHFRPNEGAFHSKQKTDIIHVLNYTKFRRPRLKTCYRRNSMIYSVCPKLCNAALDDNPMAVTYRVPIRRSDGSPETCFRRRRNHTY